MLRLVVLSLEFSALFVAIPLLVYYRLLPNLPIAYLLIAALAVFLVLRSDPTFDFSHLTSWNNARRQLLPLLVRNAVLLILLGLAVRLFAPQLLFSLIKRAPYFWLLIMLLYPLLSVYPQELIYRAFFFHRYQPLFGSGFLMILASALAFGFVHIIFGNWLAVTLCILGGLLFSFTYQHTGSLLFTCVDHAIFGNFLFAIGLGRFFYHGSRF
jgi:membrane protease YdiL (CAAX protease family)